MSEGFENTDRPADLAGRILYDLSRLLAIFGGVVVGAMAVMTVTSIIGRALFGSPISGDVELTEIGTGTAVFAFLPYCQMMRGNIIVDFFLASAPAKVKSFFDFVGGILFLAIGCLLGWRTAYGGFDMYQYAETTGVLAIPRWISFPYAVFCLSLLVLVIIYTLLHPIDHTKEQTVVHE